ncbi:MAG: ABC transporter permease [Acidobacteria bacterium]|nr:ABC transporter permease [Acidobacteriota bacterium]
MNFVWAIVRREVKSYFVSPLAYTATAVFLVIQGVFFVAALAQYNRIRVQAAQNPLLQVPGAEDIVRSFFGTDVVYAVMLIVPLLTMRLLADERRQHTAELLLTAPMTTRHLVVGKFLGSVVVLLLMLVLSCWMPILLYFWGDADIGVIALGFVGALLYGSFVIGVGLLASSLTESAFVAALLALLFIAGFTWLGSQATELPLIGKNLDQFTPLTNLGLLSQGVLDTHALVYFLTMIAFVLDLTARVLDSQRWR